MAESPAHRFGQVIGGLLEEILQPALQTFANGRGLFLDKHGARKGVRSGQKLSWQDGYGNSHDLDFVIEKAGSPGVQGRPVAFIEAAWRRYTKHSKNKAQEIQGAILPISDKYKWDRPFLGAVLAGEFTRPSLNQLARHGFTVVSLSYESIISVFCEFGIDARFDEATQDREFRRSVDRIEKLELPERHKLKERMVELNKVGFDQFFAKLAHKLDSIIDVVTIIPLFGSALDFQTAQDARSFIKDFDAEMPASEFQKYEVIVKFANGDRVDGIFSEKEKAIGFLEYVAS